MVKTKHQKAMKNLFKLIYSAIMRCKKWIITIFAVYCFSCLSGIIMVHLGSEFALNYRDKIVGDALKNDNASINHVKGNKFKAALYDFGGNLVAGSIPQAFLGLGIILPFLSVTYQGWVGGIVSVNSKHESRLDKINSAFYYIIVLILQYIPYSLSIGAGLNFGLRTYRLNKTNSIRHFRFDKKGFKDILLIYIPVIPLFFIASCFEFLI
jgi:hypothetical protein